MKLPSSTRAFCWALAGILATPASSWAGPLFGPYWIEDTPSSVFVSFSHGPALPGSVHMGDVFTSPSGYWQAGIDITEGRSASTGQYVVLTGTLQHLLAPGSPSPSNPGSIIDFTFFLRGIDGPVLSESTDWIVVSHPVPASFSDADVGHAFINGGSDPSSGEITIFSLDMEAFHTTTPEPSTWLLVGTGMLGVAWWSRRRRQVTIR